MRRAGIAESMIADKIDSVMAGATPGQNNSANPRPYVRKSQIVSANEIEAARCAGRTTARVMLAFDVYEAAKMAIENAPVNGIAGAQVINEPWVFTDHNDRKFILERELRLWGANEYHKVYEDGTRERIEPGLGRFFEQSGRERWGYMTWKWSWNPLNMGWEFVPGRERKSLPVIDPNAPLPGDDGIDPFNRKYRQSFR